MRAGLDFKVSRIALLALSAVAVLFAVDPAYAQATTKEVVENINASASKLPNLITTVAYISGIGLAVLGIMKLKAHVDSPPNVPMREGLIRLGAGGALLALPMTVEVMANTIGGAGLGATGLTGSIFGAVPGTTGAGGVGQMIGQVVNSFGTTSNILTTIAYLSGLFLAVSSIMKFKDHVDKPSQVPISDGVKRLIAGGMFLSLPMTVEAVMNTLGNGLIAVDATGRHSWTVSATPTSLDEVAVRFISDISGPISVLLAGFSFIAGLALVLVGISRLTKGMQDGPRGPAGIGTIMTFLAGGGLMQLSNMVGAFSASLFGDEKMASYAVLSPDVATALGTGANQVISTIEALMLFVAVVGYVAFIRGWFVLKAVADGAGNVSIMQGVTFLLGGSLAINLGDFINVISNTLGYAPGGGGFGVAFS